jgi:hypothetical protein
MNRMWSNLKLNAKLLRSLPSEFLIRIGHCPIKPSVSHPKLTMTLRGGNSEDSLDEINGSHRGLRMFRHGHLVNVVAGSVKWFSRF